MTMATWRRRPRQTRAERKRARAQRAWYRHRRKHCPVCTAGMTFPELDPDLVLACCRKHYGEWLDWSEDRGGISDEGR